MSGTSLDAVDAALLLTDGEQVLEFGPVVDRKYTPKERAILQRATDAARDWNWTGCEPELEFAEARKVITQTHIDAFERLCDHFDQRAIRLAGVHGQTVLHRRPTETENGATLQLIDAPDLARALGVRIAYDFRTDDVLAGGEGAPLAPIYHSVLMAGLGEGPIAVLNLGGVANITAKLSDGTLIAFDTGPANGPIDEWVERNGRGTFDRDGLLGADGQVDESKVAELLNHNWFSQRPPKSLDRYDFNAGMVEHLSVEDGAATLTAFSARAVAAGITQLPEQPTKVIACGGGRHNPTLIRMLRDALPCRVMLAEEAGWRGDSIEAEAFALLAVRTLRGLPISFPLTTGVAEPMTGGKLQEP